MRDGKLYLSLNDAIALALENNLDIAIARYNLNIADTDILRAQGRRSDPRRTIPALCRTLRAAASAVSADKSAPAPAAPASARAVRARARAVWSVPRSGLGPLVNSFDPDRHRNSAGRSFQSDCHQHFPGRASGKQSGPEHRHRKLRLQSGIQLGHES